MAHASLVLRRKVGSADLPQNALSLLLGTGFTLCLFLGIARYLKTEPEAMPPDIEELHAISLPIQPPPPPRMVDAPETAQAVPELVALGFEAAASESPVKIAASPPTFDIALPIAQNPPRAAIRIARLEGSFKPQMEMAVGRDHVYQTSEVDQRPVVLYRAEPKIPNYVREDASMLRVVLLFVVDTKGAVGKVRILQSSGNPQFDSIVSASIRDWTFSPAIKKGKPVKCLIQQGVNVKWSSGSRFST